MRQRAPGALALAMLALLLGSSDALMAARAPAVRLRADLRMVVKGREWETANVPRGKVTMNPFNNLKQMQVCRRRRLYGGDQPISAHPYAHAPTRELPQRPPPATAKS